MTDSNTPAKHKVVSDLCRYWKVPELKLYGRFTLAKDKGTGKVRDFGKRTPWGFFGDFTMNDRTVVYPKTEGLNHWERTLQFKVSDVGGLEDGKYYWVTLEPEEIENRQKNPYLLKIVSTEPSTNDHMTPKEFVQNWFHRIGSEPVNAGTIARQLSLNELELYTKTERFVFELIQNADDMPAGAKGVDIEINLLERFFVFRHSGKHFQREDVRAICDAAHSSKRQEEAMTGYKGIGFKSVFTDSVRVFIRSGHYSFKFDKEAPIYQDFWSLYAKHIDNLNERAQIAFKKEYEGKESQYTTISNIPWQVKPVWVEWESVPNALRGYIHGYNVCIALEIEPATLERKEYDRMIRVLISEPRFLLFLKNVRSIKYTGTSGSTQIISIERSTRRATIMKDGEASVKLATWTAKVPVNDEGFAEAGFSFRKVTAENDGNTRFVDTNGISLNSIPEKLARLERTAISFAAQSSADNKIQPIEPAKAVLFNYLPTEDKSFSLPFLVNADFVTNNSREFIQVENIWNHYLMFQIGYNAIKWLRSLSKHYADEPSFLQLLPNFNQEDKRPIYTALWRGISQALEQIAFLPSAHKAHKRVLVKDSIIDATGVQLLIGVERFAEAVECSLDCILHPNVSKAAYGALKNANLMPAALFGWNKIPEIIASASIQTWLLTPRNNVAFVKWLDTNGRLGEFARLHIFLDQHGTLQPASALYRSLGADPEAVAWAKPLYLHPEVAKGLQEIEIPQLKDYSPQALLEEALNSSGSNLPKALEQKESNYAFWRFVAGHWCDLSFSSNTKARFKSLPRYDFEGKMIERPENANAYIFSDELSLIAKNGALPEGQFAILAGDYVTDDLQENWTAVLKELGSSEYSKVDFVKREIVKRATEVCRWYQARPREEELLAQNFALWQLVLEVKNDLSSPELELLGALPVMQATGGFEAVKQCFLADEFHDKKLAELLHKFHPETARTLISDSYVSRFGEIVKPAKLGALWKACKVKHEEQDLISRVIKDIDTLGEALLIDSFLLISKAWDQLAGEQQTACRRIKVKLEDGSWALPADCILGEAYTSIPVLSETLRDIRVTGLISDEYLHKYSAQRKREKLTEFFRELGANVVTDLKGALEVKIKALLERKDWDVKEDAPMSGRIITELSAYHNQELLSAEMLRELQALPLLCDTPTGQAFCPARDCFLSSAFNPALDLQRMEVESAALPPFVSDTYISDNAKAFLTAIDVMEDLMIDEEERRYRKDMPSDYVEWIDKLYPTAKAHAATTQHFTYGWSEMHLPPLLVNSSVAKVFWNKICASETFRNSFTTKIQYKFGVNNIQSPNGKIKNYPAFFAVSNATLPTQKGGLKKPSELYSYKLRSIVTDENQLPFLDFSGITVEGNTTLEEWLGIRQEADLAAILSFLKTRPSQDKIEGHKIWEGLEQLQSALTSEDVRLLEQFAQSESLPSQAGKWQPISKLHIIEQSDNYGVRRSEYLLHDKAKKLASTFGIKQLQAEDMLPTYEPPLPDTFKQELQDRLRYIAFMISPEEWEKRLEDLKEKTDSFNFIPTREISMKYEKEGVVIKSTAPIRCIVQGQGVVYVRFRKGVYDASLYKCVGDTVLKLNSRELSLNRLEDMLIRDEEDVKSLCREHSPKHYPQAWDISPASPKLQGSQDVVKTDTPAGGDIQDEHKPGTDYASDRLTEEELAQAKKLMGRPLTSEEIKDANLQAQIRAINWLAKNGYGVSEAESMEQFEDNHKKGLLYPVYHKDTPGEALTIMCRSALSGFLYVSYAAWENLAKSAHRLFICRREPHQHQLFVSQAELGNLNGDAWVMKLDGVERADSLNRLFRGEGKWGDKLHMIISLPGNRQSNDLSARKEIDARADNALTGVGLNDEL